jgi:DNA-directed RNA polymerase specialized sigma24 family protein
MDSSRSTEIALEHIDDRANRRGRPRGDRDAFRRLVDREGPAVVRACYRVLGDIHEAEDAAQEAFVTAYRSLARRGAATARSGRG